MHLRSHVRVKKWFCLGLLVYCSSLLKVAPGSAQSVSEILQDVESRTPELIEQLQSSDENVRSRAAYSLGLVDSVEVIYLLIDTLREDRSPLVRWSAAKALGNIGSEEAIDPLIESLSEWSVVRAGAVSALTKIGSEKVVDHLISILQDPSSPYRIGAIQVLGQIGNPSAIDPLITALQDSDFEIRLWSTLALREIGSEAAYMPLIDSIQNSTTDIKTTNEVDIILSEEIGFEDVETINLEVAVTHLIGKLKDFDNNVKHLSIIALGEIGSEVATEPLIEVLKTSSSSINIRVSTATALGEIGSEDAVNPLIETLQDVSWLVRESAAQALGEIRSEVALSSLVVSLQDPEPKVRIAAARAIGSIGSSEAIDSLIENLQESDPEIVWNILRVLETARPESIVEKIENSLVMNLKSSEDSLARGLFIQSLQKYKSFLATSALIERLSDLEETPINRYRTINSLSHYHHIYNISQSSKLINDLGNLSLTEEEDRFVRYGTFLLLSSADSTEAVNFLDAHKAEIINLIESNYTVNLPFYLPEPLSPEQTEPSDTIDNSTLVAAINPHDSTFYHLPFDIILQPIIPSIPQEANPRGANPGETRRAVVASLVGRPAVCRFSWISQNWNRCQS